VSDWAVVCLTAMAVSLVIMTSIQIGIAVMGWRIARQALTTVEELRRDVKPLIEKANKIADDAARVTALATLQVERVDRLLASTTARVDETLGIVQQAIVEPVRHGAAIIMAVRAAFAAFRGWTDRPRDPSREEDDALFVG
jgi:hypothetical protein